jgi:hypothetical protein
MHSMLSGKLLAFDRLQGVVIVRASRGSAAPGSQLFAAMLSRIYGTLVACKGCDLSLWHANLIGRLFKNHSVPTSNSRPICPLQLSAFNRPFRQGLSLLPPVLLANLSFNRTNCGGHRPALSTAISPQFSG